MITREQASHLAQFARTIRPTWDELAIINILADHKDSRPGEIFNALVAAATNPNAHTPKAIDWAEHWQPQPGQRGKSDADKPARRESCRVDGHSGWAGNCPQCRSELIAPADPKPCPKEGHRYYAHNCLDCRRQAAKES